MMTTTEQFFKLNFPQGVLWTPFSSVLLFVFHLYLKTSCDIMLCSANSLSFWKKKSSADSSVFTGSQRISFFFYPEYFKLSTILRFFVKVGLSITNLRILNAASSFLSMLLLCVVKIEHFIDFEFYQFVLLFSCV